ncbi:MAG: hypothetical protein MI754_03525 [Chromatiales bacterium]|nr:hypothetical protein [Chromatiales bacterium]
MKWTMLILAALCISAQAGKVCRCQVNGQTVFSQTQCAEDYEKIDATPKRLLSGTNYNATDVAKQQGGKVLTPAIERETKKHPYPWRNEPNGKYKIKDAIATNKVLIGFTKEEAIQSWGEPTETYQTLIESGMKEQLIYHTDKGRRFVFLRDGWVVQVAGEGNLEY